VAAGGEVGFTYFDGHHLWFVCTTPNRDGEVVIVNATTRQTDSPDITCIVGAADHPWLKHESVILYQKSRPFPANNFEGSIKRGDFKPQAPASDELLLRIRKGALDSEFTPREVWEMVSRCRWKPSAS
jgi:hypothetical protein